MMVDDTWWYPLVTTQSLLLKISPFFEIVDFPIKHGDVHSYVSLPEANLRFIHGYAEKNISVSWTMQI